MVSSRRGIAKRRVFRKLSVKSRVMRGRKLTKKSKSPKGYRVRRTRRHRGGYNNNQSPPGSSAHTLFKQILANPINGGNV